MRIVNRNPLRLWTVGVLFVMHHWSLCVVFAAAALAENPYAAAARAALTDLESQPAERRAVVRYLTITSDQEVQAAGYLLNAVSRSRTVVRPELVQPGLLRIDLSQYANPREPATQSELHAAWESLVAIDPYFHIRTLVVAPLAEAARAKPFPQRGGRNMLSQATTAPRPAADAVNPRTQIVTVDGGWIPADISARLRLATTSAGAVLRGDFFVAHAAAAPTYYDFAGVPRTEGSLLARLGIDRAVVDKLSADTAANLLVSGVTSKPRRIVRLPGPLGGTWFSRDVERETPDRDPLRNPINFAGPAGPQELRYDASEWFAQKENKFWLTAVFDAAGNRQDVVADKIAKDTTAHDGIVRPLVSCIRCHELNGGTAAMQPFRDDQFALLSGEAAILQSYLPQVARRVVELYNPARLARDQERDREDYATAVEQATGLGTHGATETMAKVYASFVDRLITPELAAAECGVSIEHFTQATHLSTDPIILALRSGRPVKRQSYEASWPEIMALVSANSDL